MAQARRLPICRSLFIFTLPPTLRLWLAGHQPLWQALIAIAATLFLVWCVNLVAARLLKRLGAADHPADRPAGQRPGSAWHRALFIALERPLRWAMWIVGLTFLVRYLAPDAPLVQSFFAPTRDVALILLMAWFLFGAIRQLEALSVDGALTDGRQPDMTAVNAVGKLARVSIVVIAILMAMPLFGFSISAILAFGGVGGIAVGFAAQGLVANLLGGLAIFAGDIFRIGEDIIIPGSKLSGTVQEIGWRATRVMGWDGKPFYVPNALFNTSNLVNHSRMKHRVISESLPLRYQDLGRVRAIIAEGNALLQARPDIEYFTFRFDNFGDNALKLRIYAYVRLTPEPGFLPWAVFAAAKEDVLLQLADIARRHDCELILPVTHVAMLADEGRADEGQADEGQADEGQAVPPTVSPSTSRVG